MDSVKGGGDVGLRSDMVSRSKTRRGRGGEGVDLSNDAIRKKREQGVGINAPVAWQTRSA